jgi:hypothetical protein
MNTTDRDVPALQLLGKISEKCGRSTQIEVRCLGHVTRLQVGEAQTSRSVVVVAQAILIVGLTVEDD